MLLLGLVRMKIRVEGFRDDSVQATEFLRFFLAVGRGVEVVLCSLDVCLFGLQLHFELLLLQSNPVCNLLLVGALIAVDVCLEQLRLQVHQTDFHTQLELFKEQLPDMCFIQGKQKRPFLKLHVFGLQIELR